eukprot:SRR837773.5239.p1 GENE.SRR837773.5239~~SRR837773.5239.p1  ORF type:complete len:498 (-),score=52.02 SRR837773.5239:90-1583(-)
MDIGRYTDVALNVIQSTITLFFVSGYIFPTYLGLLVGHGFIYWWDHRRVLQHMMSCDLASDRPDRMAQRLWVVPCCFLAGAFAVQCSDDEGTLAGITAFALHGVLHMLFLDYAIPRCWPVSDVRNEGNIDYGEHASERPGNWFNTNVVHALRSRYIHQHDPPCIYYERGKEFLQKANEHHGMFYSGNRHVFNWTRKSVVARRSIVAEASGRGSFSAGSFSKVRKTESARVNPMAFAGKVMNQWRRSSQRSARASMVENTSGATIEMADTRSVDKFSLKPKRKQEAVKKGYLEVRQSDATESWARYWCVLFPNRIELYQEYHSVEWSGVLKFAAGFDYHSADDNELRLVCGSSRWSMRSVDGLAAQPWSDVQSWVDALDKLLVGSSLLRAGSLESDASDGLPDWPVTTTSSRPGTASSSRAKLPKSVSFGGEVLRQLSERGAAFDGNRGGNGEAQMPPECDMEDVVVGAAAGFDQPDDSVSIDQVFSSFSGPGEGAAG